MKIKFDTPFVPVSWGELLDKVTILEIKRTKIFSPAALANIDKEIMYLTGIIEKISEFPLTLFELINDLKVINLQLWEVEDLIREKEAAQKFDGDFIALARSVYKLNDNRAKIKRDINEVLKSDLMEEKSYKNYL